MGIPSQVCLLSLLFLLSYLGSSWALFRHLGRMTGNLGAGWALFSPTFPILELPGALPLTLRVPPFFIPAHSRSEILSLQCSFPHERHRYLIHAFPRSICTLEEKLRGALCLNQSPDGLLRNSRHWQALVSSQRAFW